MGWAYCKNAEGRSVGYGVVAMCDQEGCNAKIDRGLGYVCGNMHDGDEHGCGQYFCGEHLEYWLRENDPNEEMSPQLCQECGKRWERNEENE